MYSIVHDTWDLSGQEEDSDGVWLYLITPTYRRLTQKADLTRMSQTIDTVHCLFWIVVEDGNEKIPAIERLLNRTATPHVYLHFDSGRTPGFKNSSFYTALVDVLGMYYGGMQI